MKKIPHIFILFISVLSFAQNPKLFEKRWFVESIDVDGVSTSIPSDHYNFPFAYIDFYNITSGLIGSSNELMKTDCHSGFTAHLSYTDETDGSYSFHFVDFNPNEISTGCETQDTNMLNFMQDYKNFFLENINDDFSYFILDIYGIDHLQINKPNGDRIWFTEIFNIDVNDELTSTWDLTKLIVDGNEYFSPDFSSFTGYPFIILDLKNYYTENIATGTGEHVIDIQQTFNISGCNYSESMLDFYSNNSVFYLYGQFGTLSDCGYSYLSNFNFLHNNFYFDNLPGAFSYTISQNNGTETLIVTNNIGNQAFYSKEVLSVQDFNLPEITIYPNPTKKILNVFTELTIKNINIYSLLGQNVLTSKNKIIDVSPLEKGTYILVLTDNKQQTFIKKFYKF